MDSDDQYDEFGNFLGDAADSESDLSSQHSDGENDLENPIIDDGMDSDEDEKPHNGTLTRAADLIGSFESAEIIQVDPTNTGLDQPVIKPSAQANSHESKGNEDGLPQTPYSTKYLVELCKTQPERIRNIAVVGGLHVGKSSLVDLLAKDVYPDLGADKSNENSIGKLRFLNSHSAEITRGITIRSMPLSLLLLDLRHRSHPVTFIDCPGHPDFSDEFEAALDVVEGAILVLDSLEGFTGRDRRILSEVLKRDLPFVVVLNKLDRLLIELRFPPRDTYLKLKQTLDEINSFVTDSEFSLSYSHNKLVSPMKNNVVFASCSLGFSFNLSTWSSLYENNGLLLNVDKTQFEKLLWGNVALQEGKFFKPVTVETPNTFETLILDPIYKLVSRCFDNESSDDSLAELLWENYKLSFPKSTYKQSPKLLINSVFTALMPTLADFIQAIVTTVSSPSDRDSLSRKCPQILSENTGFVGEVFAVRIATGSEGYKCLTRIVLGSIKPGDKIFLKSEDTPDSIATVSEVNLPCGRFSNRIDEATTGMIVVLSGLGDSISKSASLFGHTILEEQQIPFNRSRNGEKSIYKVAVECENPAELPRLIKGLQTLSKVYLGAFIKLEDSGEYTVLGLGQLFLDCFLEDLRRITNDSLIIKVSDAMVRFSETCDERSVTKLSAYSASKQNNLSIIAEPVQDRVLSKSIETGRVNLSQSPRELSKLLRNDFKWDALAARSLWGLGPRGLQLPSLLLNDSLEGQTDKALLELAKNSIIAGFESGVNEGPLCGEAIRDTKFKILDATLNNAAATSSSQIIPMSRNAVHIGLLTAGPRLLEPIYKVFTTCFSHTVPAIMELLDKRRGWVVHERPIGGTQFCEVEGYVPVIDSIGLDVDMRMATMGMGSCVMEFFRWDVVPGDPLDKDCELPAMKPVPRASLARDFVMKTRKRKGLTGEPNLQKYIDPELFAQLQESGIVL